MSTRTRFGIAGFALGLLIVLVLPSTWLFTENVTGGTGREDGAQYACPMFCVVMDEKPEDGRCPVCGMELNEVSGELKLNRDEQRMTGIEAVRLVRMPLVATVRVMGEVEYDERLVSQVTTRMSGWLTEVPVEGNWVEVAKGDPLVSIYSPELLAAQEEFLVARDSGDESLLAGARRRLALLGIGAAEIKTVAREGKVTDSVTLRAPRSGVVVELNALPGASVRQGAVLVTVADLSRVWIQAQVYERDLPRVRLGQDVRIEAETLGASLTGRVAFVDPAIDRRTRTARVRIEVENPKGPDGARLLRIGQRIDAVIEARISSSGEVVAPGEEPSEDPLALPASAVLRTGERTIVYALYTDMVSGERNHRLDPADLPETVLYQLHVVRVGSSARRPGAASTGAWFPVLDAGDLPEGATIVARGNLLLDSQAQLSGAPSLLFPQGNRGGGGPHDGH